MEYRKCKRTERRVKSRVEYVGMRKFILEAPGFHYSSASSSSPPLLTSRIVEVGVGGSSSWSSPATMVDVDGDDAGEGESTGERIGPPAPRGSESVVDVDEVLSVSRSLGGLRGVASKADESMLIVGGATSRIGKLSECLSMGV